jgi:putative FmdB family regulatory protein
MPIYEYQCLHCSKEFEILVRPSSPATACPECGSTGLRKKLSAFAALTSNASSGSEIPGGCQGCGVPGGPGACGFQPH